MDSIKSADSEFAENLMYFVTHFVKELEDKLEFFHRILEHETTKPGKTTDLLVKNSQDVGASIFGAIFLLLGLPSFGANVGAAITGKAAELLQSFMSGKYSERVANLTNLIKNSREEHEAEFRITLVKTGVDIFSSFETLFMMITTSESKTDALRYIATDAVNRALNYKIDNKEASIAESVILGESKRNEIYSLNAGFSNIYIQGDQNTKWYTCGMYNSTKYINTSSLFKKSGIVTEEEEFKYFARKDSRTEKYGYRRLLREENWVSQRSEYTAEDRPNDKFKVGEFKIKQENFDKISDDILKHINDNDEKLSENRLRLLIEELQVRILSEIQDLKKVKCDESKEILEHLKNLEEKFKSIDDIVKLLGEVKEDLQGISTLVAKGIEENSQNFKKLFDDMGQEPTKKHIRFNMKEPVPFFTGRDKELQDIKNALDSEQPNQAIISQCASITGLGGIGKSELARKFASKNKEIYKNAIWISAETPTSLQQSFQELVEELQIPIIHNKTADLQERAFQKIMKYIFEYFKSMKTLLIFDNVDERISVIDFLSIFTQFSSCGTLYVLITSRKQNWQIAQEGKISVIPLTQFSPEEALKFVKAALEITENSDDDIMNRLTYELQYFPLALKQAVACIKQQKANIYMYSSSDTYSVSNYLEELPKNPKVFDEGHYEGDDRYSETLYKTWDVTMRKIGRDSSSGEISLYYFDFISYLYPDNIRIEAYFFNDTHIDDQRKAIKLLHDYSMINYERGIVSIHRLVQQVTRLKLRNSGKEEYILSGIIEIVKTTGDVSHIGSVIGHAVAGRYKNLVEEFDGQSTQLSLNDFRQKSHIYAFSPQFGFAIPDNFSNTGTSRSRFRNLGDKRSGFS